MKINFLKRCAATLMAVSVLSTGLTVSAAENTAVPQNAPAPTVSDASGTDLPYDQYLSALLDVCFRNDARAFVALGLGSEEDAAEIYNSILDAEMSSLDLDSILGTECPESLKNDFRTVHGDPHGSRHDMALRSGCCSQRGGYDGPDICRTLQQYERLSRECHLRCARTHDSILHPGQRHLSPGHRGYRHSRKKAV